VEQPTPVGPVGPVAAIVVEQPTPVEPVEPIAAIVVEQRIPVGPVAAFVVEQPTPVEPVEPIAAIVVEQPTPVGPVIDEVVGIPLDTCSYVFSRGPREGQTCTRKVKENAVCLVHSVPSVPSVPSVLSVSEPVEPVEPISSVGSVVQSHQSHKSRPSSVRVSLWESVPVVLKEKIRKRKAVTKNLSVQFDPLEKVFFFKTKNGKFTEDDIEVGIRYIYQECSSSTREWSLDELRRLEIVDGVLSLN
jgi:hypothetical protein